MIPSTLNYNKIYISRPPNKVIMNYLSLLEAFDKEEPRYYSKELVHKAFSEYMKKHCKNEPIVYGEPPVKAMKFHQDLSAFENENRIEILRILREESMTFRDLAHELSINTGETAYHIAVLKITGMIKDEQPVYKITEKGIDGLKSLETLINA